VSVYVLIRFANGAVERSQLMSYAEAHRWAAKLEARGVEVEVCEATMRMPAVLP
jgi:hypothetical protein